nr:hypothetical protein [Desulfobulbaceae bacterium]
MIDTTDNNPASPVELLRTLHELKSMRSQLIAENEQYKEEIQSLASILETAGLAITSSDETINAYKEKRDAQLEQIEKLSFERNRLADSINQNRLKLKAVQNDTNSSSVMIETMERELENIENEKAAMQKRLISVGDGISEISAQKKDRLPDVMGQDKILKKMYRIFKEAEDRMEVSIHLSGTKTSPE